MIEPRIEHFLDGLEAALQGLRRRERARAVREARDHLLCAAAVARPGERGASRPCGPTIEAFGAVESIAASYARPARSRAEMVTASALAVVAVVLALAIAPPGGRLGQILIPTSHAAVPTPAPPCTVVLHAADGALVTVPGQRERNAYCNTQYDASVSETLPTTPEQAPGPPPADDPRPGLHAQITRFRKNPIVDLVVTLAVAAVIAYVVQLWIVKPFQVPSGSMERTFHIGDRIIAARFLFHFTDPARGDIIVFHPNGTGGDAEPVNHVASVVLRQAADRAAGRLAAGHQRPRAGLHAAGEGLPRAEGAVRAAAAGGLRPGLRAARPLLHDGRQPRQLRRLARLGLDPPLADHRPGLHDLLAAGPHQLLLIGE